MFNKILQNKYIELLSDILIVSIVVAILMIWPTPMLISAPSTISVLLGFCIASIAIVGLLAYIVHVFKKRGT